MWESQCSGIQIDYNGNQGVFTEIDQCQNDVSLLSLLIPRLHTSQCQKFPVLLCCGRAERFPRLL